MWEFFTSLGYPSDIEFEPSEEISLAVIYTQEQKETLGKEKEIRGVHAYGEIGSQYVEKDMRDYIGEPLEKGGLPGMAYKSRKGVYRK